MLLEASTPPPVSGGKLPRAPTKFRTGIIHVTCGGAVGARQRKKNSLLLRNLLSPSKISYIFLTSPLSTSFSQPHTHFINNNLSQWVSPTLFLRLAFPVSPLLVWFFLLVRIANPVCPSVANTFFNNRSYVVG